MESLTEVDCVNGPYGPNFTRRFDWFFYPEILVKYKIGVSRVLTSPKGISGPPLKGMNTNRKSCLLK